MLSSPSSRLFTSPSSPPSDIKHTSTARTLAAGPCTATCKSGKLKIPCPCTQGIFTVTPGSPLEGTCEDCDHLLSLHRSFGSKSSPTDILASAGNSDHTRQRVMHRLTTSDPTRCLRRDTVSKLAAAVDDKDVIHVRGTPASGKTVLSELLRDYYHEQKRKVFLLKTWKPLDSCEGGDPWTQFASLLQERYRTSSATDFFDKGTVIIVDEAQGSYQDISFWNTIIKERRDGRGAMIKICLFCSYGSPRTGVDADHVYYTPATFGPAQRITLTPQPEKYSPKLGLFYTPDEFHEAVGDGLLIRAHKWASRRVKSLVDFLQSEHRHDLKHGRIGTITKDHVLDDLKDDAQVFEYVRNTGVSRSFPTGTHLTHEASETLSKILLEGNMLWDDNDVGLRKCYERGWVQRMPWGDMEVHDVAVLPSRLHEKWLEYIIGKKARPLPARFNKLDELCLEVLSKFSTMNLRHAVQGKKISTAAKYRPLEAQYQDEFYRSFSLVAGRGVPICSEWSRTGDGRVDFYIPGKQWAIELLRDHDRVNEHISRFKEGGKYHPWLKENEVEHWIIIDCASSPLTAAYSEPRLWTAVFANGYSQMKVYDYENRLLTDIHLQN
ncbi:hypothetical protein ABOM_007799 [Aspergillus bombycis]|uniref:Uncharacterized protein n=1 Tax=Aspergillus bombycis TaxID=109264 RepID=A0A1F7ZX56_9EURO|nr:hypothetical protein ABOM_007799 [Aspergillus bombycis]OGM44053.1 hypothetical protein ABOM_007799 [Aspergillus bombycis]